MSGWLYSGYCYPTLVDAVKAEISIPPFSVGTTLVQGLTYTPLTSNSVTITWQSRKISEIQSTTPYVLTFQPRTYQICTDVGPAVNYSGLSLDDVQFVSWSLVLVFVIAFSFKSMMRVR